MLNNNQNFNQGLAGIFSGLLVLFLMACGSSNETDSLASSPLQTRFYEQIRQSCQEREGSFHKEITNLQVEEDSRQDSTWQKLPKILVGETEAGDDSLQCVLFSELSWTYRFDPGSPQLSAYFDSTHVADTLIFVLGPDNDAQSELKEQKVLLDAEGKIRFVSSIVSKTNWLYQLNVDIRVHFDKDGFYQHHEMEVKHDVSFIDADFHALVTAQLDRNE